MALARSQKQHIESVASELLNKLEEPDSLPIDLEQIAKAVGLKVEYFPFSDEISGLLKKELSVIGINETQHPRRQRFTLAHEIGHYVLGHNINHTEDLVDDNATNSLSDTEREANYFASVILMPKNLIKKSTKNGIDLSELSSVFQVSEQAMTIRLLELKLV